ncbi:uncharacterized protein [Embiotoca jacksoni]|uniref:uncharacterized protein n=1 Tax=Embiotoca jacksoni TaxID=100190 RepID=UPI003704130E
MLGGGIADAKEKCWVCGWRGGKGSKGAGISVPVVWPWDCWVGGMGRKGGGGTEPKKRACDGIPFSFNAFSRRTTVGDLGRCVFDGGPGWTEGAVAEALSAARCGAGVIGGSFPSAGSGASGGRERRLAFPLTTSGGGRSPSVTATAGQHLSLFTIKGHDVTLPCENVIPGQHNCDITDWLFVNSNSRSAVELIKLGQIGLNVGSKSDRLSVTSNCSLVIKNVTDEDVGFYTCRKYIPRQKETDFDINLSVVKIIHYEVDETVTLDCSVLTYGQCRYTVEWVNTSPDMKTSSYQCSAIVTFTTSHVDQKSEFYKLLKCKVRHVVTKEEKLFSFSHQTSDEDSTKEINTSPGLSWWYIAVLVALAALLIILVAVVIWKKNKRNKTQKEEKTVLSLNPVETSSGPEEHQVTVRSHIHREKQPLYSLLYRYLVSRQSMK